jgi:hypothetical protein
LKGALNRMIKIYGLKFYTRTTHEKIGGKYFPKMLGVIEGPIDKMMKAYQEEFSFMRHKTTRTLRPSKKARSEQQK